MRTGVAALVALAFTAGCLAGAEAAPGAGPAKPRAGAACKPAGARSGALVCARSGARLLWRTAVSAKATRAAPPAATKRPAAPATTVATAADPGACTTDHPPLLRNIGVALGPYDPATAAAGAFRFTRERLTERRLFMEFGYVIPNAQTGPKVNPQPTLIVPRGTPVLAMVDGIVSVHQLWSTPTLGDYSVMISCTGAPGDRWSIETEHIVDLVVKAGDRVTAGQVIGHAGPLSSNGNAGLHLVELGILTAGGGGRPLHLCPFASLHPSVRKTILEELRGLIAAWEAYAGDTALYDESAWADGVPGCLVAGGITE